MSTKKKILITAGIGTAAVVAGVAPAIASTTNIQSSNINVNPGTTNPDNPGNPDINNPDDVTNLATIPTNDEFVYSIDNFNVLPNVLVDEYLQNLFAKENFFDEYKGSFTNSSEYANVAITYKKNSVNEINKTFELLATPINGKTWSDNTNETKTITVNIKNIETADAVAPDKNTVVSYNREIDGTFLKTNQDLNNLLSQLFSEDQSAYFPNFKNVKFTYILQTADLTNRTFKMIVAPLDKHNWTDKDQFGKFGNQVTYTVKLTNFVILNVNDAEAPKQNTVPLFNALVDGTNVKSDKDLNNEIKSLFSSSDQSSNFVDTQGKQVFKNVKVSFYENSAKLQDKTFKVQVSLKDGHSWSDSSKELPNSFDLQVKINNFAIVGIRDSLTPRSVASFTKPVLSTNFSSNADLNNYLANA
ncbi:MAG: hypothetical protein K2H11_01000, partial [Malacoplasma sp.]|nr:hypothetical protein [Malacoplasma sp.]MDE6082562.1 hypothetical protein [Malacoplasma sp.]